MREIKFRYYNAASKLMHPNIYYAIDLDGNFLMSMPLPENRYPEKDRRFTTTELHNGDAIMQYTGIKDKNGVEIYEGDVVKILYTDWPSQLDSHPELSHEEYLDSIALTRVVIWSVQGFYVSHAVDGYAESMEPGAHGYVEVIGNIYENPDLLSSV